jgi:DNA-binding CsgD family transcriptional regulator
MMHSLPIAVRAHRDREQVQAGSNPFKEKDAREMQSLMPPWIESGIILLNWEGEILHQNQAAREITDRLTGKNRGIVFELYLTFKQSEPLRERVCRHHDGAVYLFRPVLLQPRRDASGITQLLILIERVFQDPASPSEAPIKLTPREKRVVQLLSQGMTNKEVANGMHIGEYTVKHHVKQIMRKFQVTTRAAIVAKSFSHRRYLDLENEVTSARAV